eukprot:CAMPEP_0197687124 /NCGR_PEP_ID=MMETSP1338-20131121/103548_1 /TAXON_ID=43686 ORGANISM="Pelagodinium beii, Strain RCC1491" /NCGR_SAMPLE_ID=MMETSP1338 /ASSEMBLY_ACC=CAM_ASM_000754 /LENGTH=543 /DNA_ID=CAMNT_0043269173 /DNA_START=50 /DNA_END=1677 /DNA_ORIENTATION=-
MGTKSSRHKDAKSELKEVRSRLGGRKDIQVTGRYHLLPKRVSDDYDISETVLGSGYNGQVFLATSKSTGEKVAVKPFKLLGIEPHQRRELKSEAEIFLCMDHPHVARLKDIFQEETTLFFVMECLEGGELFELVSKRRNFSEKDAAMIAYQMLLSISYLHANDFVHRDIKLENFMYDKKDAGHLKLIDFGFSRAHRPTNKRLSLVAGTEAYMAPEVLEGSYDRKCDMWSFGVVMYVLLMSKYPFDPKDPKMKEQIKAGAYELPDSKGHSAEAIDFLKKLLEVDAEKRLSVEEALKHPWLAVRDSVVHVSSQLDEEAIKSFRAFTESSKFRQHCLTLCAWSMTAEQRDKVGQIFLSIDKDKSGRVSLAELKDAMVKASEDTNVQSILQAFEVNDNKEFINYSDFLAAMLSTRINQHEDVVHATFRRFDRDGSGEISLEDMRTMLLEHFDKKDVTNILQTIDVDGNGMISYEEFFDYLVSEDAEESHLRIAGNLIDKTISIKSSSNNGELSMRRSITVPVITPKAKTGLESSAKSEPKVLNKSKS